MDLQQRIRRDTRLLAGDPEATALLECIVEHLFDPRLDVHFIARVSGACREVRERLAARIGPLKGYFTELRMIEAGRLVRDSDLTIKEITGRLGYPIRTFRRVFKECHGVQPRKMRKQARAERARTADPATAAATAVANALERLDDDSGRGARADAARLRARAGLGLLDPERGADIRSRLRRRHPDLESAGSDAPAARTRENPEAPVLLGGAGLFLETVAAGAVIAKIMHLPADDLSHAMLDGTWLCNSTAFGVLKQYCYAYLKYDPQRVVEIAELGVQQLQLHRDAMGEVAGDWTAALWAFLARVQAMTGDFAAADRILGYAWEEAATGRGLAPWVEIDGRRIESTIRLHQGRAEEAARALDRAVELSRGFEAADEERIQTVYDRLDLASYMGDAESALPLCDELEELAVHQAPPHPSHRRPWHAFASYHRGKACVAAGRDRQAERFLARAAEQISEFPGADGLDDYPPAGNDPEAASTVYEIGLLDSFIRHELARLDGRAGRLERYHRFLCGALERYQRFRTPVLEAAAEAELAALCALLGRRDEARRLAASAVDFLNALPGHRRIWSSVHLLRVLAAGDEVSLGELEQVLATLCYNLDALRWKITGAQATAAAQARVQQA